jgi:mono/diheme cytochrome c family protein
MRSLARVLAAIGGIAVLLAITATVILSSMVRHGFSARDRPSRAEALIAETMRRLAIPSAAKQRTNPIEITPEAISEARAHFADHCAQCHANDGSGQSEMGMNMYPKPPDMRQRITQDKSDGELFYIIQNGVRLTGMPAWGETGRDDADSWKLVAFIRRLPNLTAEDITTMESLNPKSSNEWREQVEEETFLKGGEAPKAEPHGHQHGGHP